jgi:AraC family transcriptional regulator of adaptative response / DNA-3-methyladenine glycosylase II
MSENGELPEKLGLSCGMPDLDPISDKHAAYRALTSRDARFDGVFFVGVTSTGIYCRPICPVKAPQQKNCRFFSSAESAEKSGFRPCLRCRPELAPGNAPVDHAHRVANLMAQRIDEGLLEDGAGLEDIAKDFQLSSRQLRRIIQKELGVSPIELLQTRRLLLAKQLLTESKLSVTEIAFASGFSSLRRFNHAFLAQYRMPPSRLRKQVRDGSAAENSGPTTTLQLGYRPPFDWDHLLAFLKGRRVRDVELVTSDAYLRTVRLGRNTGWIRVTQATDKSALNVELSNSLVPALPALLGRLRNVFDLAARPDLIAAQLSKDKSLRQKVRKNPGIRVPGAFDGFEMAVRAVLGQQVTVKAATTLAGRFAEAFGKKIDTPFPELTRLTPLAERVAKASVDDIAKLGIVSARAKTILALAQAFHSGALRLDANALPNEMIEKLTHFPGIGQWTAHYIAMRGLRWPDAFPKEDIAVRKNLGGVSAKRAEELSQAWKPWRSYAVMHIWNQSAAQL